jgi:hypothetical protein
MSTKVKETKHMGAITTKPIDVNKFWEKTPTPLKYLLLIAIIVAGSYFLFSRKVDSGQIKELEKIEQGIDVTYQLVDKFNTFQVYQAQYNEQVIKDIQNIYSLIGELNDNVNTKFNYLISNSGKYNADLIDKLNLLNDSFDKLSKAYKPTSEQKMPDPQIVVKKVEK